MNVIDTLSAVSKIEKDEIMAIFLKVKDNKKKLDVCNGHDFVPIIKEDEDPSNYLPLKYRCTICEGTIDHTGYIWYTKGVEHGQSNCNKKNICV